MSVALSSVGQLLEEQEGGGGELEQEDEISRIHERLIVASE
jgi:hypothetical protein